MNPDKTLYAQSKICKCLNDEDNTVSMMLCGYLENG